VSSDGLLDGPPRAVIVVPCFNEASRLDGDRLLALVEEPGVDLLLVDDGSTDGTGGLLAAIAARAPGRVRVLSLSENAGKGEAVRAGMARALEDGAQLTGYLDADLSTPPAEMLRILKTLAGDERLHGALGSRVLLLGRRIERQAHRHYLGRVFGTAASAILGAPIYDTQCGAKAFRRSAALEAALREPFSSSWAFDVELIGRLLAGDGRAEPVPLASLVEVPLREWRDVKGSKLGGASMLRAAVDLARIRGRLLKRRRDRGPLKG
jgi:dolichyl-phosphate beta-glucosyltransferase